MRLRRSARCRAQQGCSESDVAHRKLIDHLKPGPLDIIGDVHGDLDALQSLLSGLGYRDGRHPAGRRLVFVGDLTDRGRDSRGVLRLVMDLVREGKAQCIAGNHELNLLRNVCHDGNEWWTQPPATEAELADAIRALGCSTKVPQRCTWNLRPPKFLVRI